MNSINSQTLKQKYVGKEVICDAHKNARIHELTSYCITIKTDDGFRRYDTGTGPNDNAVANGYIKFVERSLQNEFIVDYEKYVHSEEGRIEAWAYYSQMHD